MKKLVVPSFFEASILVEPKEELTITLQSGHADGNGYPFSTERKCVFYPGFLRIFVYKDAIFDFESTSGSEFVVRNMRSTYNELFSIGQQLNARREMAFKLKDEEDRHVVGPRILVVGQEWAKQSSIASLLASFAVRTNKRPLFLDLEPISGLSPAGCMSAKVLDKADCNVEMGLDGCPSLMIPFGYPEITDDVMSIYKSCLESLADKVNKRCESDPIIQCSGLIVSCCRMASVEMITTICHLFNIDILIAVDSWKLSAKLRTNPSLNKMIFDSPYNNARLPNGPAGNFLDLPLLQDPSRMSFLDINGISDVPELDGEYLAALTIWKFYFGSAICSDRTDFKPTRVTTKFEDLIFCRVSYDNISNKLVSEAISPSHKMKNKVLACVEGECLEEVPTGATMGYAIVEEFDFKKEVATLLVPCVGPLPSQYLVVSEVIWSEAAANEILFKSSIQDDGIDE
eukprot:TRINITY_DN86566_c1_g2_i1.p1 TRINITY_DN86566_c1_g2~~TRINITY_DN86566_c1_g2_i1.p1  ORF type:complete len:458 (-),score=88.59 TRINITY_DN86566_c1_g2_i1:140-1513(-)